MTHYAQISINISEDFLRRLDDWRQAQVGAPERPDAIRTLVELSLSAIADHAQTQDILYADFRKPKDNRLACWTRLNGE